MGLKDLFIKSADNANDKPKTEKPKETTTKFPKVEKQENTQTSVFNFGFGALNATPSFTPSLDKGQISQEHLAKAIEVYQNGFDSLNQSGYDFYEYYQAVTEAGVENAMAFTMAFKMAKSMDKSITKESLLQQSEFYSSEIIKSYNNFISSGTAKKEELLAQKTHENESLVNELDLMKQQMEQIKVQIQDRENKLKAIGSKYEPKISEIDSKLQANDIAKNKLIQSIENVKTGILTNLK